MVKRTQRLLLVTLVILSASTIRAASSLEVDRRTVRAGSSLTITLVLEGEIAKQDSIELPATNLFIGLPSMSTEFSWVNGVTTRRKIFRWTALARNAGPASVGPLLLRGENGRAERFGAIPILVSEAPAAPASESEAIARIDSEEPVVVVAELDRPTAVVGEQRVVSWWVYTRSAIRSVRVSSRPTFADFWIEEIPLDAQAEPENAAAGYGVSRYLVRRTAIYPVRSGELTIPPLGVTAAVMEAIESPFDRFGLNRRLVETHAESRPLRLTVTEPPKGVAITGNVTMNCSPPVTPPSGPSFFDVTLAGDANLRAATPPVPDAPLQGRLDWSTISSQSTPAGERVRMVRRWRAAIYPDRSGLLQIPSFSMKVHEPATGVRTLSCAATTIDAKPATPHPAVAENSRPSSTEPAQEWKLAAAVGTIVLIAMAIAALFVRSRKNSQRSLALLAAETYDIDPRIIREKIEKLLTSRGLSRAALANQSSDVAEDLRALEAAIDMRSRESWRREELDAQVKDQLDRFLISLAAAPVDRGSPIRPRGSS